MIIKSNIHKAEYKKDKFELLHMENISQLAKENYELRKDANNGFSANREYRQVARFSPLGYIEAIKKYPMILQGNPQEKQIAMRKAINDPEFWIYKSVGGNV